MHLPITTRGDDTRRRCWAAWLFTALLIFILPARSAEAAVWNPATAYRIGSAAFPFGGATAIAKLDPDALPDLLIADRIAHGSRGYEYRLELDLSLGARQVFRFFSAEPALNVSARDLDNDKDLDVVLTEIGTGKVVGVWLNNGLGQFSESRERNFPGAPDPSRMHGSGFSAPSLLAPLTSRQPLPVPLETTRSWTIGRSTSALMEITGTRFEKPNFRSCVISRAPPRSASTPQS
jgi:hypothetical protein